MDDKEKILSAMRMRGPLLPSQVAKLLNTSNLFASAHLSSLKDEGKIKISIIKIGGSPLYYLPSQINQLEKFIDELKPKEKEVFFKLKEKKLLKDKVLDLAEKVAIRQLKDFAIPLSINNEIFWKYYLLSDDELNKFFQSKQVVPELQEIKEEIKTKPLPVNEIKSSVKKVFKEKNQEQSFESKKEFLQQDGFLEEVKDYLKHKNVLINKSKVVIKNKEVDLIISIPTVFGNAVYYCKAKNKKKSNEGDLSFAFVESQKVNLPCMYLTKGSLTKKAQDMVENTFKSMIIHFIPNGN